MPDLSRILLSTRYVAYPDLVNDLFFTETPALTRMRQLIETWTGGAFENSVFRFRPMSPSPYKMGVGAFTLTKHKTLDEQNFLPKFYNCPIPEFEEELMVFNKGENQIFDLLEEDISNALMSLDTQLGIHLYGGVLSDDAFIQGFEDGIGHAAFPSWTGVTSPTYGGASRATYNSPQGGLNGNVLYFGTPTGALAAPHRDHLHKMYWACARGKYEPDLFLMNTPLWRAFLASLSEQQVVVQMEKDILWGARGFTINGAIVLRDEYCPSLVAGKTAAENFGLGNYKTATISTNPISAGDMTTYDSGGDSGFAAVGTMPSIAVGEVAFCLTTEPDAATGQKHIKMLVDDSEIYGFGMTDFKGTPDTTKIVAHLRAATNIMFKASSRLHCQAYGWNPA